MSECCDDYYCRRKKPVLIRLTPFSRRFIAVTNYTQQGDNLILAANGGKHDVHEDVLHSVADLLDEAGAHQDAAQFLRSLASQGTEPS